MARQKVIVRRFNPYQRLEIWLLNTQAPSRTPHLTRSLNPHLHHRTPSYAPLSCGSPFTNFQGGNLLLSPHPRAKPTLRPNPSPKPNLRPKSKPNPRPKSKPNPKSKPSSNAHNVAAVIGNRDGGLEGDTLILEDAGLAHSTSTIQSLSAQGA